MKKIVLSVFFCLLPLVYGSERIYAAEGGASFLVPIDDEENIPVFNAKKENEKKSENSDLKNQEQSVDEDIPVFNDQSFNIDKTNRKKTAVSDKEEDIPIFNIQGSNVSEDNKNDVELDSVLVKDSGVKEFVMQPKESKNTFTVTQEQIRENNYKNVEEILADAPGIIVNNTAFGPKIDMRGNGDKSFSKVKVMVDGVSINPTEEAMASLPINSIPIESIKKIDITPGGGATLYGSGSVGGVVNIVTNSNATRDNFFMDMKYGSYDSRSFGFSGGNNLTDKLYTNYGFNYINSEGYRKSDNTHDTLYLGGFDYKINDSNKIRLQARHGKQKFESTSDISKEKLKKDRTASGLNLDTDAVNDSYTFDFQHRLSDALAFGVTGYRQIQDRDIFADSIDDIIITIQFLQTSPIRIMRFRNIPSTLTGKLQEQKDGVKLKGNYTSDFFDTIFGYDYLNANNKRKTNVRSAILKHYDTEQGAESLSGIPGSETEALPVISNIDIDLTKKVHSLYAFNKIKFIDIFDFTFGGRAEWTKYTGYRANGPNSGPTMGIKSQRIDTDRTLTNYAGEVGFLYKYSYEGSFYLRYEKGFVTPFTSQLTDKVHDNILEKRPELTGLAPMVNVASIYVANNLQSEITDTVEIGFRDFLFGSFIALSLYLTDTNDEITAIHSGLTNPAIKRWKYRNIGKTRRMGFELEAEQEFYKFSFNQSLSYVNAKILKGSDKYKIKKDDKIPMVPDMKFTVGGKYNFTDNVSFLGNYTYITDKETRELNESEPDPYGKIEESIEIYKIKGYGIVDVGLLYRIDDYAFLKFGVKNLLNKRYNMRETSKVVAPASERNCYFELNVKF